MVDVVIVVKKIIVVVIIMPFYATPLGMITHMASMPFHHAPCDFMACNAVNIFVQWCISGTSMSSYVLHLV